MSVEKKYENTKKRKLFPELFTQTIDTGSPKTWDLEDDLETFNGHFRKIERYYNLKKYVKN